MKKLLFAGVAFATLIGAAHAADMYVKAPVYAPTFTWSGCYVGGNIGGAWSHSNFTTSLDQGTHLGLAANVAAVGAAVPPPTEASLEGAKPVAIGKSELGSGELRATLTASQPIRPSTAAVSLRQVTVSLSLTR
jgi:opacity protein-like surface antigen